MSAHTRRLARVERAFLRGANARRGESMPFKKRKYVAAALRGWAHARAVDTGREPRVPPTFRPRQQAEGDPRFPSGSSLGRVRRQQHREPLRRWHAAEHARPV